MRFLKLAFVFLIMSSSLTSEASILDFESLKKNDASFTFLTGTYSEAGYSLRSVDAFPYSFASAGDLNPRYAGSASLTTYNFTSIGISNTAGFKFDFYSLDVAPVFLAENDPFGLNRDLNAVYQTLIRGLRADGSTIEQIITIPNATIANTFSTVQLLGFTDLNEVYIFNNAFPGIQLDNLVLNSVSTVPVPSSLILFMSSILVLAGIQHRKKYI